MTAEFTPIRPLGPMEQYSSSRNSMAIYGRVMTIARYTLPSSSLSPPSSPPSPSLLLPALHAVIAAQPYLHLVILAESSRTPLFASPSHLDPAAHIHTAPVPALPSLAAYDAFLLGPRGRVHAVLDTPWADPAARPPWSITLFAPTFPGATFIDVVFAAHHALCDGMSGRLFHAHLLAALRTPGLPSPHHSIPIPIPAPPPILASQEALIPFRTSWLFLLRTLWREFAPRFLQPAAAPRWSGPPIDIHAPRASSLRLLRLPPARAARVLALARAHGTTLTALLHALLLRSLAATCPARGFVGATTVNLRPLLPADLPRDGLGDFVTTLAHEFSADDADAVARGGDHVWDAARSVKHDMTAQIGRLPADNVAGMVQWVTDFHARWRTKHGQSREEAWEVSNLGAMDGGVSTVEAGEAEEAESDWSIRQLVFTFCGMVGGPPMGLSVAGVKNGVISISLTWLAHPDVDPVAEQVMCDLDAWLTPEWLADLDKGATPAAEHPEGRRAEYTADTD